MKGLLWFGLLAGGPVQAWKASGGVLPSGMTLSRASTGWYWSGATYAAATLASAGNNVARFERLPSGKLGLLIEGERTNLRARGRDMVDASWTKTAATATTGTSLGVDGGNCSILTEDNTTNTHQASRTVTGTALTTYCIWGACKRHTQGTRNARIINSGTGGITANVIVDPDDGSVQGTPSGTLTGVLTLPQGWFAPWMSAAADADGGNIAGAHGLISVTTASYAGDNASNMLWDICSVEQAAFPSSPIPTPLSVTVTRSADVTAKTVSPPAAGWAAVFEIRTAVARSGNQFIASWHDGTANERVDLFVNSSGQVRLTVVDGGATVADITGAAIAVATEAKVAISLAPNSIGLAVAGVAATRDVSNTLPTVTSMVWGHDRSGANHLFGHIISGPSGLQWLAPANDATLQALTA